MWKDARRLVAGVSLLFLQAYPAPGPLAQTAGTPGIEDTLEMLREVDEVVAASRRPQPIREAPSAVTVVTADEIRAFGYRTLAEVLAHSRGFVTTYDRNYAYIGSRGFARTGDYNARVQVLIDGHRLNDNVYGAVLAEQGFPLDLDLVSRIEVIRGPGSALYGSNAVFAVINVVTRQAAPSEGLSATAIGGSYGTGQASLAYGSPASSPVQMLASGTFFGAQGQDLYFKEFDTGGPGAGIADGADAERTQRAYYRVHRGNVSVQALWSERSKEVPTASFSTVFNDGREKTVDGRAILRGAYERPFGQGHRLEATVAYDWMWYRGDYPYDYPPVTINKDLTRGAWATAGALVNLKAGHATTVTLGSEYNLNRDVFQSNRDEGSSTAYVNDDHPFTVASGFVQAERKFGEKFLVSAGGRYDYRSNSEDTFNPRVALVLMPGRKTTLKFLAGRAFRAPNAFEQYYSSPGTGFQGNPSLSPETIVTHEVLWDQQLGPQVEATFSAYRYRLSDLIAQFADPNTGVLVTMNTDEVRSDGLETEVRFRVGNGLTGVTWVTYNDTEVVGGASFIPGSPRVTGNLGLVVPLGRAALNLAPTLRFIGSQRTATGGRVGSYAVADLTLTSRRPLMGLTFAASIYNVAGRKYGDVVGLEFVQETIPQDGRAFRFTTRYAF